MTSYLLPDLYSYPVLQQCIFFLKLSYPYKITSLNRLLWLFFVAHHLSLYSPLTLLSFCVQLKYKISRIRREFGAPVIFSDRNAVETRDGFMECASYQDKSFSLKEMERSSGTQAIPNVASASTQTQWQVYSNDRQAMMDKALTLNCFGSFFCLSFCFNKKHFQTTDNRQSKTLFLIVFDHHNNNIQRYQGKGCHSTLNTKTEKTG